jgi:parallel beta-helix repeat protein
MRRVLVFLILIIAVRPGIGLADTHYVSKTGTDEYPYASWATAADSTQKGINAASAGDTVRVGAGTYRETIRMTAGITLIGSGMDSCIIYPLGRSVRDIVYGADSGVVEGFHIKGWQPGQMEVCTGIRSAVDSKLKRIANNKITNCDWGIYMDIVNTEVTNNILTDNWQAIALDIGTTGLIINNTITHNEYAHAIHIWDSASPRIIKNLISISLGIDGNFIDSIFIQNNLIFDISDFEAIDLIKYYSGQFETAPIRNNTVIGNLNYPVIKIYQFSNEIRNNIISNGSCGIKSARYSNYNSNPQVSYNNLWNNRVNYCTAGGSGIDTSLGGNIYLDPMFVGDSDYHLQYGSPCINAGDPNIKDPDSSRSDIGCYGGRWGESYPYQDYPPKAPDSLSAISESTVTILSWKPNTESDLSHYTVYRDTLTGFIPNPSKIVGQVPKDSSVFRDYDFVLGRTYYYRLSAWDLTGHESEYSDELQVLATDVGESTEEENRPPVFQLFQNYPNPFNSSTVIWYRLPDVGYQPAEVEITIYNLLGKLVKTLVKTRQYPGEHKVLWDGRDDSGKEVASGIYFYRMKVSGLQLVKPKKMVLLR